MTAQPRTAQPRSRHSRRWAATAVVAALVAVFGVVSTSATWVDREWVSGTAGTLDCTSNDQAFSSRGQGRVLSGNLLGLDLDTIAEVSGVEVTHDGIGVSVDPPGSAPVPGRADAYFNPLDVTALSVINAGAAGGLTIPLDTPLAALGQYARARADGTAAGASGYVTGTGAIALAPEGGYPELATLDLSALLGALNHDLGELLPGIANVSAEVGAVAGRAHLDGCGLKWADPDALTREYLASSLALVVGTPTVGGLAQVISGTVATLEDTVNGLGSAGSEHSVLGALTTAITGLVNGVAGTGTLHLADLDVDLSATVDTSALQNLLATPFASADSVVTIDLAEDQVRIDTAALLAKAYSEENGDRLNALPPNTNLLADPQVLDTLTGSLLGAVTELVGEINGLLTQAIDAVAVDLSVVLTLRVSALGHNLIEIGTVTASVEGSLADLVGGTLEASISYKLKGLGLLGVVLNPIVNGLLKGTNGLLATLTKDLAATAADVIETALFGLRILPGTAGDLAAPIVGAVSGLYTKLFLDEVVGITFNAQNLPTPGPGPGPAPGPADWDSLTDGRFEVAAIRIGVVDALAQEGVRLYLGRASVGPVAVAPG